MRIVQIVAPGGRETFQETRHFLCGTLTSTESGPPVVQHKPVYEGHSDPLAEHSGGETWAFGSSVLQGRRSKQVEFHGTREHPHCPPHGLANRSAFSSPCHTPWVPLCYFLQISKGGLVNCICLTQKRPQMSNRILVFLVKPLQTILNPAVSTASLLGTEAHFGHGDAHRGVRECVREEPTHLARLMMHV